MDKSWGCYTKWNMTFTKGQILNNSPCLRNLNDQIYQMKEWDGSYQGLEKGEMGSY